MARTRGEFQIGKAGNYYGDTEIVVSTCPHTATSTFPRFAEGWERMGSHIIFDPSEKTHSTKGRLSGAAGKTGLSGALEYLFGKH